MDSQPNKKICPHCYFANDDFVKVCIKCGYAFPRESIKEIPDSREMDDDETPPQQTTQKCDNPKAPKKTCPVCGARVYINRAVCPECDHHFEFKSKKKPSSQQTTSKTEEIKRSPGMPIKSYLFYLITMAIWFAICFFGLPWLYSKIDLGILIADFVIFIISIFVGMVLGNVTADSYEYRSSKYALFLSACSIIGIIIFDYLQLKTVWAQGDFEQSLIYTCMLLVITAEVITQAIAYYASIKEYYCNRCDMANLVFLENTEDGESHIEYKFKTHEAETHTATVTTDSKYRGSVGSDSSVTPEHYEADRSTTYTVKYKTPEWQENLGLHKYTKYTKVYQCKRCGWIKKESGTREEKI